MFLASSQQRHDKETKQNVLTIEWLLFGNCEHANYCMVLRAPLYKRSAHKQHMINIFVCRKRFYSTSNTSIKPWFLTALICGGSGSQGLTAFLPHSNKENIEIKAYGANNLFLLHGC
jgi:hypothetical protein